MTRSYMRYFIAVNDSHGLCRIFIANTAEASNLGGVDVQSAGFVYQTDDGETREDRMRRAAGRVP